ncbi:MAG: UDP-3-O-(3-hydroxymyristoyl)glucosamine N-acyltransferase [Verrucomicrobia bacterium]|nr:UDP-3-O-(3-hydroxymyristoyl)glucosamine N-acyltransferase [Verrucomicrobiota bacterium]
MQVSFSPADIQAITRPKRVLGATAATVRGLASLTSAAPGDLSFLGNAKYRSEVAGTRASVVLLPSDYEGVPQADQLFLFVDNPSVALAQLCARIEQSLWPRPVPGIHPSASIAPGAQVAATATVGPLCVVEAGAVVGERTHLQAQVFVGHSAVIGEDCWLMPGTILAAECVLKNRVRLQPGAVIGSDGFGYEFTAGRHEKIPQVGNVVVEDDVEIGANSTVDRARFSRTVIGQGTKIDNLVQVAHNVVIGRHCIICAQVGLSGSTTLEDYVVLGGQAATAGHLTVGKGVKAGGRAGIISDIAPGAFVNGNPAMPYMLERRIAVLQQRLPDLFKRFDALEAQVKKSSS